jgi:hypothetical protein
MLIKTMNMKRKGMIRYIERPNPRRCQGGIGQAWNFLPELFGDAELENN